ncbi:Similar to tr/Q8YT38/Q8YT38 [Microcystis aeruginosa PCC 9432]|jgi:hypothetical protein|uniref:Similar to tr/Q8YT38/Q8YT38 n=1 Tax=Microcystis aeruginosa PCC 9432 TaxID=1160280 RepID=A0A822L518_MICAE|nr:hypothetical protein [Microcystis aeruginosa]TRU00107.1 MAG: hypothetical protein EWV62_05060 [Microcystis aeruginosa Ma_OC_LR_19540900_S633]CCH91371.1 Similar to tr/Q8YT38/Q8YT38 [Microcystis aeruginosa PCC 9432]
MDIESTKVTPEEIAQFRAELADNLSAITSLDVIDECDGYLKYAIPLLLMRETGTEPDRSIGDLLKKCRQFICQEEVREGLQSGMIAPFIEPISVSAGIPVGVATAIGICAFKLGMKKVCADCGD